MARPAPFPGRSLEASGDRRPRGMIAHDRTRLIGRLLLLSETLLAAEFPAAGRPRRLWLRPAPYGGASKVVSRFLFAGVDSEGRVEDVLIAGAHFERG